MNTSTSKNAIRSQVLDEAAAWLVEIQAGDMDLSQRQAFDAWLRASPEHVRAYLELLAVWERGAALETNKQPGFATLIEWAREDDNVVSLPSHFAAPPSGKRIGMRVRFSNAALAASVLIAVAGVSLWFTSSHQTYKTGIGEQRSIALPDGSLIELNAQSKIRIRYSDARRHIELLAGQGLFKVARDTRRPFTVRSDETLVRALGTRFDIYRKAAGTVVTVVEGRVAVTALAAAHGGGSRIRQPSPALLSAGQQLSITPEGAPRPIAAANTARAIAWTQRRLIFSATPLAEVASEFNRYNSRRLVLDDPRLEELRINGVFSSTDPRALLAFLHEQPGVAIVETDEEIRVMRRSFP